MKKSELKEIIKDCLLEILFEGFGAQSEQVAEGRRHKAPPSTSQMKQHRADSQRPVEEKKKNHLDSIKYSQKSPEQEPRQKQLISSVTDGFPPSMRGVMNEIFEDTMKNTLSKRAESSKHSPAEGPETSINPMDIDGSSKWAELAFAPRIKTS